jgi:hypothetical protein
MVSSKVKSVELRYCNLTDESVELRKCNPNKNREN